MERALAEAGQPGTCRILLGGHTIEGGRSALEQELRREDRVTAVIAATNVATLGAIKAIQGLQLVMPRDISLIGFDDFDWMTALRPYVTAVAQPTGQLAGHAWKLLLARMTAGRKAGMRHVTLEGELRLRESTGRVAAD